MLPQHSFWTVSRWPIAAECWHIERCSGKGGASVNRLQSMYGCWFGRVSRGWTWADLGWESVSVSSLRARFGQVLAHGIHPSLAFITNLVQVWQPPVLDSGHCWAKPLWHEYPPITLLHSGLCILKHFNSLIFSPFLHSQPTCCPCCWIPDVLFY